MNISVVIPAFNEEARLKNTLDKITFYLDTVFADYEIIVVDDCSTDKTVLVACEFLDKKVKILKNKKNMGKGYSVRKGVMNAKFDLVLFADADMATPIEELTKFVHTIEQGYDIVIASRNLSRSNIVVRQPMYRQLLGKSFPLLVNFALLPGYKDTQCGFKLFKTALAKQIFRKAKINRWAFDVEILYLARKAKLKVKEMPITWIDKQGSKLSPVRDSLRMMHDLVQISLNNASKRYGDSK